jgi:hypothetical protein
MVLGQYQTEIETGQGSGRDAGESDKTMAGLAKATPSSNALAKVWPSLLSGLAPRP